MRGFGFFNVTNLSISNIVVERCGGVIDQNATKYINISFFYFQPGQRAVFLFNHCFDLILDRTEIREYCGFAVVGANVMRSSSVSKTVLTSYSPDGEICTAAGAFIFYVDSELPHINSWHNLTTTLTISESNVHGNSCPRYRCPVIYTYSNPPFRDIPTTAAQGVNVAFSQQSYFVHIHIQQSNFSSDEEGLLLLHVFKDSVMSKVTIDDECIFDVQGLEVRFYFKTGVVNYGSGATAYATEIKNSIFLNTIMNISLEQQQHLPGQLTKVSLNDVKMINNVVFTQNTHGNLILEMNNIFISPQEFTGSGLIIMVISLAKFTISSTLESQSHFKFATIVAIDTDVHLSGNLSFTKTGLLLYRTSHLILQEPLSAMFVGKPIIGNYSLSVMTTMLQFPLVVMTEKCPIQFSTPHVYTPDNITDIDIHLTFNSTSATAYDFAVYATTTKCELNGITNVTPREVYMATFHIANDPNIFRHISSQPTNLTFSCKCRSTDRETNCSKSLIFGLSVATYPGKTFQIGIAVTDENSNPVSGIVTAEFMNQPHFTLGQEQGTIQFFGKTNCSMHSFTVKNPLPTTVMPMYFILTSNLGLDLDVSKAVYVHMLDCPTGFVKTDGICKCIPLLAKYGAVCNIDTSSIKIPMYTDAWIGVVNNLTVGVSKNCPAGYCNLGEVDFSGLGLICDGNRTGVVCGDCDNGLSVQFGSTKCSKCSSMWLLSIAVYALAGILLVILLFVLRLTVDKGTVNGLIFYANILGINARYFLRDSKLQFLLIFISLVNLELGFPVCFYNGMNDIVKTGLQFVFPIYIWSIVIFIIFASRYSTRVSRLTSRSSVQVLATLIHLSYSKLLSTTVDILVHETVETESHNGSINTYTAWYFDGNVQYLTEGHIVLFILALMILTLFIIPYTIILMGASFFVRYKVINYFKPVFDAYYGPYKDKWRFWFGSRLWVLVAMLIIYTTLGNSEELMLLLHLILLTLFILAQASIKPFKNALIGWLDLFFMLNYSAVALVTLYSHSQRSEAIVMTIGVLVATALVAFIGIVIYHIYLACNLQRFCQQDPRVNMQGVVEYEPLEGSGYDHVYNAGYEDARFREPLLGSQS